MRAPRDQGKHDQATHNYPQAGSDPAWTDKHAWHSLESRNPDCKTPSLRNEPGCILENNPLKVDEPHLMRPIE